MAQPPRGQMPGFRRRFRVTPSQHWVLAELEDDYHCMGVTVYHDGVIALTVEPDIKRAPWTTCPGAEQECRKTFTGVALAEFPARKAKKSNCTHLYDLALLAAKYASEQEPLVYDLYVSDPIDGKRTAEVRRDAALVFRWVEFNGVFTEPAVLAGESVENIQAWIAVLETPQQETVRMLRWASMIARGRSMPIEEQSDATRLPPACYTFQPVRAQQAERVGEIIDFSEGLKQPLEHCGLKS